MKLLIADCGRALHVCQVNLFLLLFCSLSKMKEGEAVLSLNDLDDGNDSDSCPDELVRVAEQPKEKWDCESILSEYSAGLSSATEKFVLLGEKSVKSNITTC